MQRLSCLSLLRRSSGIGGSASSFAIHGANQNNVFLRYAKPQKGMEVEEDDVDSDAEELELEEFFLRGDKYLWRIKENNGFPKPQEGSKFFLGPGHKLDISIYKDNRDPIVVKELDEYPYWIDDFIYDSEPSLEYLWEKYTKARSEMTPYELKKMKKKVRKYKIKMNNERISERKFYNSDPFGPSDKSLENSWNPEQFYETRTD